jgi:FdhD protein
VIPPEPGNPSTKTVLRWEGGALAERPDELAEEEPLEIRVRGRAVSVTMRTPGHDEELAAGFLLSEGIVRRAEDIVRIEPCPRNEEGNLVNVVLAPQVPVDFEQLTRHVFASSSCGLCGKATIDAVRGRFEPVPNDNDGRIDAETIASMPGAMHRAQTTFARTGGLHAAGLFDAAGQLLVLREDVGRHNAVDKVLGHAMLNRLGTMDRHVLLVSGRASFEIMQKALAGRIPVIAAVSAPSSLAVQFAEESNQTLIGFLREGRMNVYAHHRRIQFARPQPAGPAAAKAAPTPGTS